MEVWHPVGGGSVINFQVGGSYPHAEVPLSKKLKDHFFLTYVRDQKELVGYFYIHCSKNTFSLSSLKSGFKRRRYEHELRHGELFWVKDETWDLSDLVLSSNLERWVPSSWFNAVVIFFPQTHIRESMHVWIHVWRGSLTELQRQMKTVAVL